MMYFIYGLIDPSTMRVFHVGCARDPNPTLNVLPAPAACKVAEIAPATPQMVILQAAEAHPQVEWVKWCKRFRRDLVTSDWGRYESIANAFTNSNRAKRALGEQVPSDASYQAKFHEFDRQNRKAFDEMLRIARALRAEGRKVSSIDVIVNEIRWEGPDTNHTDGFKISNSFRAFYARKLQMVDLSLCGLFAMRESMADDLVLEDGRSWREFAREHSDDLRFAGPEGTDEEDTQWTY
ncbi:MAG: hypothetical protein ABR880_10465 [Candidatus Sulfotelmatobacter sp.]|jgi:hypothetical protein